MSVKACVLCGAQYTTPNSSIAAGRHFPVAHPGQTPQWRVLRTKKPRVAR